MSYEDIINLDWEPKNHKRMSIYERSAQFAPFSALEGYNEEVIETSRITDNKIIIDENIFDILDEKLRIINANIKDNPFIEIKYFVKDSKKKGGKYIIKKGNVKKIDFVNKSVKFIDNEVIFLKNVIDVIY